MKKLFFCAALATSILSVAVGANTLQSHQIKNNESNGGSHMMTVPVLTGEMAQNIVNAAALEAKKSS